MPDNDREEQDRWHMQTLAQPDAFLYPALFGGYGENARKGAERSARILGTMWALIFAAFFVGGLIALAGHFIGLW